MTDVSVAFDALTNGLHEAVLYAGGAPDAVPFDPREWLVPGTNVLSVQVHNAGNTSSDLTVRPFLALARSGTTPVPFDALPDWWSPAQPEFHTNFKLKPGEPVILSNAEGELLDLATLPLELRPGLTMGRLQEQRIGVSTQRPPQGRSIQNNVFPKWRRGPLWCPSRAFSRALLLRHLPGFPPVVQDRTCLP